MAVGNMLTILMLALAHGGQSALSSPSVPAWNGQLLPGAVPDVLNAAPFLPYYVPNGDKSIDDASPLITYSSGFLQSGNRNAANGTYHVSNAGSASASLSFSGNRVEWFGDTSPQSGIASVSIDGVFKQTVDAYTPTSLRQQRLFSSYDLSPGTHTIVITNTGRRNSRSRGNLITVDAFVTSAASGELRRRAEFQAPIAQKWSLVQHGDTGVAAMQLAVVTDENVLILDKVEHNTLSISGHPAWGALYDLRTNKPRALDVRSNSFCAGGTWLSNGTMLSIGGNPVVQDKTGSADFGDVNGLQAIRMFNPCDDGKCDIIENPARIRMASARWYNSATRLDDGSVMIIGGSKKGGWINNATVNNPTIEYFPPKNIHNQNGLPITLPFLSDTLNANLFPIVFTLPDGRVFMAANRDAMIYDWRSNTEQRLPQIPNGVRVTYPMTGTGVLLPLSSANSFQPEVMLCGGSTIDDTRAGYDISANEAASSQCSRLVLSADGINAGWSVEQMPNSRIMPDAVLLPDGKIVIVNGGGSGIAGYGNVKDRVGQSNAAHPVFTPVLYDPLAPIGKRFSSDGMPTSDIPRLYHSVASLTPNGSIIIAGSNPNLDRSNAEFATEYRVEWLSPPYMSMERPSYSSLPPSMNFGKEFTMQVTGLSSSSTIKVSLMDLGFVTHGVHMNSRLVFLDFKLSSDAKSLSISAPPSAQVYPPGPAWLYVVVDGVPSAGKKIMVGGGEDPPVDEGAIENLLKQSDADTTKADSKSSERR